MLGAVLGAALAQQVKFYAVIGRAVAIMSGLVIGADIQTMCYAWLKYQTEVLLRLNLNVMIVEKISVIIKP